MDFIQQTEEQIKWILKRQIEFEKANGLLIPTLSQSSCQSVERVLLYGQIYFRNSQVRQHYCPEPNGWSGFCCLAYASGVSASNADRMGQIVRLILIRAFYRYQAEWLDFFGSAHSNLIQQQLRMIPNHAQFFMYPAFIWMAVIAYRVSILVIHPDQSILYRYPIRSELPAYVLAYDDNHDQYFTAYRFDYILKDPDHDWIEHPDQADFTSLFN
ncbi:hypothetical protein EDC96DRAFT_504843 [Choanephora cucurbitarum]|nr:hypothetical protein EDC96DRAFT_504843 [Choanephora cucurbitarum]